MANQLPPPPPPPPGRETQRKRQLSEEEIQSLMRSMNENERERTALLNPIRRLNHGSIVSIVGIFASAALILNGCSFRPANAIQQIYQVLCIGFGFLLLIASEIASNTRARRKD